MQWNFVACSVCIYQSSPHPQAMGIPYLLCLCYVSVLSNKFRPQKEIKAKMGGGQTFHGGASFMRLQYYYSLHYGYAVHCITWAVFSLVPRPSIPAFNVARKKREEGLVRDITHVMQRIEAR